MDRSPESGYQYTGQPIQQLGDTDLITLWFDLDRYLDGETLSQIYTEMCARGIPRIVQGPRLKHILHRINAALQRTDDREEAIRALWRQQTADIIVRERVCRHCKATFTGTAHGLCYICDRFQ
jgi:hypothetical protein